MSPNITRASIAVLLLLAIPSTSRGEVVRLVSGETLVGDVRLEGPDKIVLEARFPEERVVTLARDELTPESLFSVLERRTDPKDAAKRKELGELAARLDLKGVAVAEYIAVRRLDPAQSKEMDERITRLREAIAIEVLEDAKDLLEEGNARAAILYLHTVLERYPDSQAAQQARELMPRAHETAGSATDVAPNASTKPDPKAIDAVQSHVEKGDAAFAPLRGHVGSSVAGQRAAERAIAHYEKAWEAAKKLPVAAAEPELQGRIDTLRERAKQSLVDAYLTAGSIHLQRRSIPSAERWCNKACLVDPDNKRNHELHGQIVDAKSIDSGRGWIGIGGGTR